jgi:predicted transglutaminase-like cysteine proteinase
MTRSNFLGSILLGRRRYILAGLVRGRSLIMGGAKAAAAQPPGGHRNTVAASAKREWEALIRASLALSDAEKLEAVNRFFNHRIRFGEDLEVWGQPDYWASPLETLERGAGDCEDFAIAKFFTLRLLGIPEHNLRLMYTTLSSTHQAHMVLGYWSGGAEVLLVLDSLLADIRPLAQRHDLQMQFAFDTTHLYRFEDNRLVVAGDARLLPRWQELKDKVSQEQLSSPPSMQLAVKAGAPGERPAQSSSR